LGRHAIHHQGVFKILRYLKQAPRKRYISII